MKQNYAPYFGGAAFMLLLAALGVLLTVSSCSRKKDAENSVRIFRAATGGMSAESPAGRGMEVFAQKVSEYTGGAVKIEIFYGSELGSPSELVTDMMYGAVDFCVCGDSYYAELAAEIQAYELPYLFDSLEQARSALNGASFDRIQKQLKPSGIQALSFWEIGFRQLTSSVKPIRRASDVRNLKIRCLPAPFQILAWEYAGAVPAPMDISALYGALESGQIKGQENPLSEIYTQRLYEVQPYLSITNHVYTPQLFSCSAQTWNLLTGEERQAVAQAAHDAQQAVFAINDTETKTLLDALRSEGMEIITDVDTASFKEEMTKTHTVFIEKYGRSFLRLLKSPEDCF